MTNDGAPEPDAMVADATTVTTAPPPPSSAATTTTSMTTTTAAATTTSTTNPPTTSLVDTVFVLDGAGEIGMSFPVDWQVEVTDNEIWASPGLEGWMIATTGDGPAPENGYHMARYERPAEGALAEVAQQFMAAMTVPSQCGLIYSDVEERPATLYLNEAYFFYRVYQCAPGGELVNEVEVGYNPPWVTTESSRYLSQGDREAFLDPIWQSFTSY